ncbi:MAG: glycosyltransferase [Acidobacteriota bacterium]
MRVLMPSIVDPASQLGGAWTSTRGLLELLRGAPFHAEIVAVPPVELSWAAHRTRRYSAMAQSLITGLPGKFQFQYSRAMVAKLKRLSEEEFDLVLLNGSDLLWMLPYLPKRPAKILFAHNIEHSLYADQIHANYPGGGLQKTLLGWDCSRLRRHELAGFRAVSNVLFLSHQDEAYAGRECPGLVSITVPPLMDGTRAPRPRDVPAAPRLEIGMLANFDWWPSHQGIRWFLDEVLPHLGSAVRLHLFGTRSQHVASNDPRVVKHGYVPDLDVVWSTCHFMICPVIAGGGVSIKLAEAVCRGMPVLATRYATRGLPIEEDPAIVLRETSGEWIEFLESAAARELRRISPSRRMIAPFLAENNVDRFSDFLKTVLAGSLRSTANTASR